MRDFLNPENKLMTILNLIVNHIILGFLWIVCSIPIFTVGASTTALCYASQKLLSNKETYVSRDFFHSFKQNFKQATGLWLISLLVGAFCVFDIYYYHQMSTTFGTIAMIVFLSLTLFFVLTLLYLFPYLSQFHCDNKEAIKNSLLLSIRHLGLTVLMLVADAVVMYVALYYLVLLIFAPGAICLVNGFVFKHIFKRYMPEETDPDKFTTIEEIEAMDAAQAAKEAEAAAAEE